MRTYGRTTIYVALDEETLLSMPFDEQKATILSLMPNIIDIHEKNKKESQYLWEYYLGKQDVLQKEKQTRQDINNKKVENWAYALTDFKKNWILGNPIQYTMQNSSTSKEVETLNKYCKYEDKEAKDQMNYEDVLVVGRGFRFIKQDKISEDDESPFSIFNVKRDNCEIVYSSRLGNEQLFSVVETELVETLFAKDENGEFVVNELGEKKTEQHFYSEYTIYLRNKCFTISYQGSNPVVSKAKPIVLNEHLVTEYFVNRDRISLIEIGKDIFDGINQLESLDFDDIQQFVNAIMVFTNADIDEEGLESIQEYGAVKIKSTENRKASVELLQQKLNSTDTQVFYTRLLVALHQILGIPMATDNGSVTSGDTGKGKLVGQGFASAGIRVKGDEIMLRMCDRKALKVMLKICRKNNQSEIKTLKTSELDIKFNIDKSDNLLVKTQGLMNLLSARIPKEYAVPIIDLFGDSTAVVTAMNEQEKEEQKNLNNNINNTIDESNKQNNNINKAINSDIQGQ